MSAPSSMSTNLVGRLRNTRLPRTHGLLPLFEAVVNSVHAVEEAKLAGGDGRIAVEVARESVLSVPGAADTKVALGRVIGFKVTDNGVGFTDANMTSFRTLDSDYKVDMGGRGVGRLLWLKAFDSVRIESEYVDDLGAARSRAFTFTPRNGVAEQPAMAVAGIANRGTMVRLDGFKSEYRESSRKQPDAIARQLLEHCLWYFIRPGGAPRIELHDEGQSLLLDEVYEKHMHTSASSEAVHVKEWEFNLVHVKLRANSLATHTLSWCADNRLVSEEKLAGKVPGLHGRLSDEGGQFVYSCYVSSTFLNERARPERTGFDIVDKADGLFAETELDETATAVDAQSTRRH